MSGRPAPTRRSFLAGGLAAGAGVALFAGDATGPARIEWCSRPSFPFAPRTLWVVRGPLADGLPVHLELWARGPEIGDAGVQVVRGTVVLDRNVTRWDLRLRWRHERLVPGRYEFWAVGRTDARDLRSSTVGYDLTGFTFGV